VNKVLAVPKAKLGYIYNPVWVPMSILPLASPARQRSKRRKASTENNGRILPKFDLASQRVKSENVFLLPKLANRNGNSKAKKLPWSEFKNLLRHNGADKTKKELLPILRQNGYKMKKKSRPKPKREPSLQRRHLARRKARKTVASSLGNYKDVYRTYPVKLPSINKHNGFDLV